MKLVNKFVADNKSAWAKRLNITGQAVSDKINGKYPWKQIELEAIAEFYHVPKELLQNED